MGKPAAIFNLFAPVEGRLDEMFHSGPTVDPYVKYGHSHPNAKLDRSVFNIHHDHVHVAVPKGTRLVAPNQPAPPAPALPEDDMLPIFTVTCPTGANKWCDDQTAVSMATVPRDGQVVRASLPPSVPCLEGPWQPLWLLSALTGILKGC
ncbi:MAG: hypothetical protein QOJ11_3657 [Frankiales bacterium]|jgi:hypothetical protein|nr:hypothetical protein [Frankiales bacterium]